MYLAMTHVYSRAVMQQSTHYRYYIILLSHCFLCLYSFLCTCPIMHDKLITYCCSALLYTYKALSDVVRIPTRMRITGRCKGYNDVFVFCQCTWRIYSACGKTGYLPCSLFGRLSHPLCSHPSCRRVHLQLCPTESCMVR